MPKDRADPPITVAIPTCNGSAHIEEALRSILVQGGVGFDLIVSDDRSTDDTLDRVRRIAGDRARIEVNADRLGLAGNWNRCVALGRTPLVAVFHQDDLMLPGHLADHVAAFLPETGLVASASGVIDAEGRMVPRTVVDPGGCGPVDRRYPPGEFLAELAVANPLRCSAVTLRKSAHDAAGGFSPRYRYVVDWDHWIRVAELCEVAWLGGATVSVRWHPSSETHTFKTGTVDLEETASLLDDLRRRHPGCSSARRPADRRLARAYLNRAYDAAKAGLAPLCRLCLRRAIRLYPPLLGSIVADPRLLGRLAVGSMAARRRPIAP